MKRSDEPLVGEFASLPDIFASSMMMHYLNPVNRTRDLAWFDAGKKRNIGTDDIGRMDKDGTVTFPNRKKNRIIMGGLNAYPSDLEAVLRGHREAADAEVVGMPSLNLGDTPAAFVKVRDDNDVESFQTWIADRFVKAQRRSAVVFAKDYARSPIDTALKRELRNINLAR